MITAQNDGHTIEVEILRERLNFDEGGPLPCVALWILLYNSPNQAYCAELNAAQARHLAAELVRLADELEAE